MSPLLRLSLAAVAVLGAVARAAESAPAGRSPFSPPATAASNAAAAASETLEFAGVSAMGNRTDVILFDKTARKSHLITAGETVAGISVLNYDARRDQVVIRVNGQQKTLALRKSSAPTGGVPPAAAPMPVGFNVPPPAPPPVAVGSTTGVIPPAPAPTAEPALAPGLTQAAAPASPTQQLQAKQETEARMLVSDLLEIGMAQRRAYEEAQRKAAETNVQKP